MSSTQRVFSQRNNNVTQLIPKFLVNFGNNLGGPFADISGASCYSLNLPNVLNNGGIYFVDMKGVDSSKNLLNLDGRFDNFINIINFTVNVPFDAAYCPGLEFTIFFKNLPFDRLPQSQGPPLLTIGLIGSGDIPLPYILSPPAPWLLGDVSMSETIKNNISQSLTFKSDGSKFNVVSSGPAGWLGLPALSILISGLNIG